MARKRHNRFIYQRIVVFVFIFLNCLFTAVPFIQAAGFSSHALNISGLSLQNQNDLEGHSHLNNFDDEQQEYYVAYRNKRKSSNTFNRRKDFHPDSRIGKSPILYIADFPLLIRPQYYSFLSIYYLF